MKSLNKFAAQQLSKNQMNNVKGGADNYPDRCGQLHICTWSDGSFIYICEKQMGELAQVIIDEKPECHPA